MNAPDLIKAFGLPIETYLNRRVPKKLLEENGAPTAGDKRLINEGIEDLYLVASLKPTNIGITAYNDATHEILEIHMLRLTLREGAKAKRLNELVHRAVPYPVLLITIQGLSLTLSLAQKHRSEGHANKTVLDGDLIETQINDVLDKKFIELFLKALPLAKQSGRNLFKLYEGWIDTMLALQASNFIDTFTLPISDEHAMSRRKTLQACINLRSEMAILRASAVKETQISRRVELNLKLERLKEDYAAMCAIL